MGLSASPAAPAGVVQVWPPSVWLPGRRGVVTQPQPVGIGRVGGHSQVDGLPGQAGFSPLPVPLQGWSGLAGSQGEA